MSKKNPTIIVVAYPDRGAGNDPEPFFFFFFLRGGGGAGSGGGVVFHNQGSTFFTVDNYGSSLMICLGQGGLRSLSASS